MYTNNAHTTHANWHVRYRNLSGHLCRTWGRFIGDPDREFRGDQIIIEAKLERYYAQAKSDRALIRNFVERRRDLHVVA